MNDNWQQSPEKSDRTTRWVTAFAGLVVVVIAGSILVFLICTRTYVAVTNTTALPMHDVAVLVAGSEIWSGTLQAGGAIAVSHSPAHDGAVSVRATWSGRNAGLLDCGYVAPNIGAYYELSLVQDGTWKSSIESPNLLNMFRWLAMRRGTEKP